MKSLHVLIVVGSLGISVIQPCYSQKADTQGKTHWTDSFEIEQCQFTASGENTYFILKPSHSLILEGIDGKDTTTLVITVMNETITISGVETRIVEERETVNGRVVEISKNYYAFCTRTNTVFYFGEDVAMYKDGKVTGHSGSWKAGSDGAKAGVMMPGIIFIGSRYYQEIAPTVAMDRVEIISTSDTIVTLAGTFVNCLKTQETTPLEPKGREYKLYAPGIGLVKDGDLVLKKFGR